MGNNNAIQELREKLGRASPVPVSEVTICGHRFPSPTQRSIEVLDGSTVSFAEQGTGGNDIYDNYYRIAHREGVLEVYDGDHDVAGYTEIRFNGKRLVYELHGPGKDVEEEYGDPAAVEWADNLLTAAGLPKGKKSFATLCYEVFRAPGPTFGMIYLLKTGKAPGSRPEPAPAPRDDNDGNPPGIAPLAPGLRVVEPIGAKKLVLRGGEVTCGKSGTTRNEVSRGSTFLRYRGMGLVHSYDESDFSTKEELSFNGETLWEYRNSMGSDAEEKTHAEVAARARKWMEGLLKDANLRRNVEGMRELLKKLDMEAWEDYFSRVWG